MAFHLHRLGPGNFSSKRARKGFVEREKTVDKGFVNSPPRSLFGERPEGERSRNNKRYEQTNGGGKEILMDKERRLTRHHLQVRFIRVRGGGCGGPVRSRNYSTTTGNLITFLPSNARFARSIIITF